MKNKVYTFLALLTIVGCSTSPPKTFDYKWFKNTKAEKLSIAVRENNTDQISKLLAENPKLVNFQEPTCGKTLLMSSLVNKDFKSYYPLLEKGADPNLTLSMTEQYDTYENAITERINKIFKYEYGIKNIIKNTNLEKKMVKHGVNI